MNLKYLSIKLIYISIALFLFSNCKKEVETIEENPTDLYPVYEAQYSRFDLMDNHEYQLVRDNVITKDLKEVSGIVSGRKNQKVVYMHEDSGNRNVVFVYDTLANFMGEIVLAGVSNRDWEDIAIGPGPIEGETYIYVANFGDNSSVREWVYIYRFVEPHLDFDELGPDFKLVLQKDVDFDIITYQYPDGPRDAETLLLDPTTKDLIVVTKREVRPHVYHLPYPQSTSGMAEIHFRGNLPLRTLVGGDVSPNGEEVLIKDYGAIYKWKVEGGNLIKTLFYQTPEKVEYVPEVQGESVGFTHNGDGYFTITETDKHASADPILYHYRRK